MMIDPELVRTWVEDSCRAQGVPVKITDPSTIKRVAVLFATSDNQPKKEPNQ